VKAQVVPAATATTTTPVAPAVPVAPTKPAPAAKPTKKAKAPVYTQQDCWTEFCKVHADKTDDQKASLWFEMLDEQFPGKAQGDLTPADWQQVYFLYSESDVPF
jgi:hypothetical protein